LKELEMSVALVIAINIFLIIVSVLLPQADLPVLPRLHALLLQDHAALSILLLALSGGRG
jgi:hypothetical protein